MKRMILSIIILLMWSISAFAALSVDNHNIKAAMIASNGTTGTTTSLTITHANDLIIFVFFCEDNSSSSHVVLSAVSKTAGTATVGSFTRRSSLYVNGLVGPSGTYGGSLEVWSASATVAGTLTLTATVGSGTVDVSVGSVIAVNYDNVNVPVWSSNVALPATNSNTGTSAPTVSGVSTNGASIVFGFTGFGDNPTNQTNGTGYTILNDASSGAGAQGAELATEDQSFASAQTSITTNFGTSWQTWLIIADAVEVPGGGTPAPPTRAILGVGN